MAVIRYIVADVDDAVAFYTKALEFELSERWGPPFAMVKRGDLTLWLSGPGSSASRPLGNGATPVSGGSNRLVLETGKLDVLIEKLKLSGARFQQRGFGSRRKTNPCRRSLRQPD